MSNNKKKQSFKCHRLIHIIRTYPQKTSGQPGQRPWWNNKNFIDQKKTNKKTPVSSPPSSSVLPGPPFWIYLSRPLDPQDVSRWRWRWKRQWSLLSLWLSPWCSRYCTTKDDDYPIIYRGFNHPRWLFGISSINSIYQIEIHIPKLHFEHRVSELELINWTWIWVEIPCISEIQFCILNPTRQ